MPGALKECFNDIQHTGWNAHSFIHSFGKNLLNAQSMSGFPGGASGKEAVCNAGDIRDTGSIPGLGRPPGGGNGNPHQDSCLGNPMDRGRVRHNLATKQ